MEAIGLSVRLCLCIEIFNDNIFRVLRVFPGFVKGGNLKKHLASLLKQGAL